MQYVTAMYTILAVWLQWGCAQNVSMSMMAVMGAPKSSHGRKRPQRVWVLSVRVPMMGSLTASQMRDTSIRVATALMPMPNTSV